MLADGLSELEALKGLSQNWPLLTILLGALAWFAKYVAQPLTARHITFIDALEKRDQERIAADVLHQHMLAQVDGKVELLNAKASTIKDLLADKTCAIKTGQAVPIQPQGGM